MTRCPRPFPALAAALASMLLLLAVGGPSARACTCIPNPPPREALQQADAVFAGRVASIAGHQAGDAESAGASRFFPRLDVVIELEKVWKGSEELVGADAPGGTVTLTTASQSAACGYGFEVEARYLVYAYRAGEEGEAGWTTGLCTRNAPLERAGEDLEALGEPAWVAGR